MLPHIHIFGMHLPTYGLLLAAGVALFLALYGYYFRAEYRTDRITFYRLSFSLCLSLVALGVFAFLFDSLFHSISAGRLTFGGITWLGGVAGAFPAMLLLTHLLVPKKRGYALDVLDALMPGLALAHGIGRVGCFFGGCCFGRVTDSVWGVSFPPKSAAARLYPNATGTGSLPVLPTQLFEAAFEGVLFLVLLFLSRKTKKYNVAIWSIAYGVFRFSLEFLRGDNRGGTGLSLSPAQMLSLLLLLFGVLVLLLRCRLAPKRLVARLSQWREEADARPIVSLDEVKGRRRSPAEALRELHALKNEGVITEEEYEKKKAEILERM